ncbi:YecA family protein [Metabacillus sp. 113a]
MSINRNAPCPCGSGKKYKKCCLKNEDVIHMTEARLERFYCHKAELVHLLHDFIYHKLDFMQLEKYRKQLRDRSNQTIPYNREEAVLEFWLYFFCRFENGKRGIELFAESAQGKLSSPHQEMTEAWVALRPRLVQAVDASQEQIMFKDLFTDETFEVPRSEENTGQFIPWYGTLSMLEPYGNQHIFHGVRAFTTPQGLDAAKNMTEKRMKEKNLSHEEVLLDYYLEIMAEVVEKENGLQNDQSQETVIERYEISYRIHNENSLFQFLHTNSEFLIDEWTPEEKSVSWGGNWKLYKDSEMKKSARIGEIYGSLEIEDGMMKLSAIGSKNASGFKKLMGKTGSAISLIDETSQSISLPVNAEISNMVFQPESADDHHFGYFAQAIMNMDPDQKIPMYDYLSLRELCAAGREADAELWLSQYEHNLYKNIDVGASGQTADMNTIRRTLGLPVSPFVSGSEERTSSLKPANPPKKERSVEVQQDEIPYYEQLGFRPDTIQNFYAHDLMSFYREKATGKSVNTVRKYRNNLLDLREILEMKTAESWEDCGQKFWTRLFKKDLIGLYYDTSKTQRKDFASTMKALAKWIDDKEGTELSTLVEEAIRKTEFI